MKTVLMAIIVMAAIPKFSFSQCGTNPTSGLVTISTANQIVNAYYPGTGNPVAGNISIAVSGSTTGLAVGDLVLIIQMQGADLNTTNSDAYGDGVAGGIAAGALATNLYAGYYEYNTVTSIAGSTINFTYSLANNYYTQAFTASTAIRAYQVIRVPRYYNFTISAGASVTCPPWNGSTGGVTVLDAVNIFTLNGTVNASGLGFRGGGGKNFTGAGTGNSNGTGTLNNTDYRWDSDITNTGNTTGGAKGEGLAGTPVYTWMQGATLTTTGTVEGYINGAAGRGGPANAGGGSTDGIPVGTGNNQYNTGGGGGANKGAGGVGGSGWHGGSGSVTTYPFGGYGGAAFTQHSLSRFIMGGGGGAGTANNSTTANEYQSSGGCGGGIIIARAKSYAGTGSLLADGGAAPGVVGVGGVSNTDAAGGGGAGGTIVVVTRAAGATGLGTITASAKGGAGGDMTNYYDHGPGGGGGGGIIYTNGTLASAGVAGGVNGKTRVGSTGGAITNDFGAIAGSNGQLLTLGFVPVLVNNNNVASPCGVLPVVLVSFTGIARTNDILVQWEIANANGLHHFEVEYSINNSTFSYAGRKDYVPAETTYQFVHTSSSGIVYYRLKMVDINGAFSYSKTIAVRLGSNNHSVLLFPSPTAGAVTMSIKSVTPTQAFIYFINASGKTVLQKSTTLQSGDNSIHFETATLPQGLYVVQVKVGNETIANERLQVMKK